MCCFLESDIDGEGARFILVAGAPRATESDLAHLLRTLRTAVEAKTRLPLSIGVNRGRVFAGEVGAPFRRTYTILGGTAALAARLMANAGPGELLAPRDVVEHSDFELGATRALALKGLTEPVEAVTVGPANAAAVDSAPTSSTPLVGRQRELAVMTAALAPVRWASGRWSSSSATRARQDEAPAGVRAQAPDLVRMGARCDEYERATPYFLFRDLLRTSSTSTSAGRGPRTRRALAASSSGSRRARPVDPAARAALDVRSASTPQVDDLQPSFRRARLNGVVEDLLTRLLDAPTLLLFEDAHWMDEASADLLRHLGSASADEAVARSARRGAPEWRASSQQEGTPPVAAMTLRLEPLLDDDATALARAAAGERLDDALAAVVRRAGGNPLFLQELIADGRGRGASSRTRSRPSSRRASTGLRRRTARCSAGRRCSASPSTVA